MPTKIADMIGKILLTMDFLLRLALSQNLLHQLNKDPGDLEKGRDFVRPLNVGCSVPRSGGNRLIKSRTYRARACNLHFDFSLVIFPCLAHNHRYICFLLPERMLLFERIVAIVPCTYGSVIDGTCK